MLKKSIEEKILSILNSYYKYKFISLKNIEEYFIDLPKNFKKRDVLKIIKFNAKIILPQDMEKFVNKLKERINQ